MSTFRWRNGWSQKDESVNADHVTFEPEHVVFRRQDGKVIRAVQNKYVNELADDATEVPDPAEPTRAEEIAYRQGMLAAYHAAWARVIRVDDGLAYSPGQKVLNEAALHGFTEGQVRMR